MRYWPDSVGRRASGGRLSATKRIPTVAIRKPSHEPLPARPATTAMLRAGVSVGAMFATDWPMQSTRPSALARSWGRSAALASAAPSASGPGGVIRVRTSMARSARHSPCNVAIAAYVGQTEGRLMRALKSILGGPLIDEETSLGGRKVALREVVEIFVRHLKDRAEAFAGQEITAVVHGRPVRFVDDDDRADARAQQVLEDVARRVGFRDVAFVFEPIAAAHHYERTIQSEELALIADIGGGTSH